MLLTVDMEGALTDGSRYRGIGRFSSELVSAMAGLRGSHVLNIALNLGHSEAAGEIERLFLPKLGREAVSRYRSPAHGDAYAAPDTPTRRIAEEIQRRHLAQRNPDAILFTSLFEFQRDDVVPIDLARYPSRLTAAILYDLIPMRFPQLYLRDPLAEATYLAGLKTLRSADLLLTISEASRQDAIGLIGIDPDKIVNISAAAGARFRPIDLDEQARSQLARQLGLSRPFITYVSGSDARKNLRGALDIFAALPPAIRKAHQLLLVTNMSVGDKAAMLRAAQTLGLAPDALVIAHGVGDDDLLRILNTARALVFPSLYEGFGLPVLEAMQCGLPVVAAGHSSLVEIVDRRDALFASGDIADAAKKLAQILTDRSRHAELSAWGLRRAKDFTWERSAARAWQAIEDGLACASGRPHVAPARLLELDGARHDLAPAIAAAPRTAPGAAAIVDDLLFSVARLREGEQRRLLVDVGMTAGSDMNTGIQRVVRRLCAELKASGGADRTILPIALDGGTPVALPDFGEAADERGESYLVDIRAGDDLFMLDSSWRLYPELEPVFDRVATQGGQIVTCIYDLIPELHPAVCAQGMAEVHRRWLVKAVACSHVLLCISRSVADELATFIAANDLKRRRDQRIEWFHCGADLAPAAFERRPDSKIREVFDAGPVALMVGTVEPRKGQDLALRAFERLWAEGQDISLCLIGRAGWLVDEFVERLRDHPAIGHRLHWFAEASDADLAHAYDHAEVALCCSIAEGFGLPIVEAGRRGCRVICSDIPVFREVGGSAVSYYPSGDAEALAALIRSRSYRDVRMERVTPVTWRQSAESVLASLYGKASSHAPRMAIGS